MEAVHTALTGTKEGSKQMSLSAFSLSGRTALVTGAGQGIGRAIALGLGAAGARVVVTDVDEKAATKVCEEARASGHAATPHALDVRDPDAIEALVQCADQHSGPLDILVNNAGIRDHSTGSFATTVAEWDEVFAVNVRGLFLISRAVARGMVQRRSGVIIHVASQLGLVGMAGRPAYTASKGAVVNLTKTMALEWAPYGIRVNAIAYGPIRTPFTERFIADQTANERFRQATPLGPWHEADAAVGPVLFLASAASSFATGSTLVIDGGYTAQ
jgi:gluconate 5-dehydrogenase/2-deoxy-D-gluconate 3-dehydrogenase